MKISDLEEKLKQFKSYHGDTEIEFLIDEDEVELEKIHEGYIFTGARDKTICELRLKEK